MLALAALGLMIGGCSATDQFLRSGNISRESPAEIAPSDDQEIGRAELWAQRCSQCHYARGSDTFSPQQWEIIMFHMRVRANLTVEEYQTILEFLK